MAPSENFVALLRSALLSSGLEEKQLEYTAENATLAIHPSTEADGVVSAGPLRVVPVAMLALKHAACDSEQARSAVLATAVDAFGHGAADVPLEYEACGTRLLPQIWPIDKIMARQMTLPNGIELPHCGIHGEEPPLKTTGGLEAQQLGVVLVCEYTAAGGGKPLQIETPVLSNDLVRWGVSFVDAMRRALDNLRARTKDGPAADKRWEHHESGCAQSSWHDSFDAARIVLFPTLVSKRKRPDGIPEQGGHVVAFATSSCVLASTSKNALGLCFLGDTLHLKIVPNEIQLISKTPYRLLKMKDSSSGTNQEHPLRQKAGEGFVWRWLPFSPGGPPLRAAGEFSVPIDAEEVDSILNAVQAGNPVPVFAHNDSKDSASSSALFAAKKEEANSLFKSGKYVKAIEAYDAALKLEPPGDAAAAIIHSNASQALLKLAENDEPRQQACAAEALRRAVLATELDPTNTKAYARCAAACEILNEKEAAAEFKAKLEKCMAAEAATKQAKQAAANEKREALEASKAAFEQANREQAARNAMLEREKQREREKAIAEAGTAEPAPAQGLGLTALFGLDSGLNSGLGSPERPVECSTQAPLCSR